jgi:hypothetical protein
LIKKVSWLSLRDVFSAFPNDLPNPIPSNNSLCREDDTQQSIVVVVIVVVAALDADATFENLPPLLNYLLGNGYITNYKGFPCNIQQTSLRNSKILKLGHFLMIL